MDREALQAAVHRIAESNMTKVTEHTLSILYISFSFPTPMLN